MPPRGAMALTVSKILSSTVGLRLLCLIAVGACAARDARGDYLVPAWISMLIQLPALLAWLAACIAVRGQDGRRRDLLLTLAAGVGGAMIAVVRGHADPFFVSLTIFVAGMLLIDHVGSLIARAEELLAHPVTLMRVMLGPWVCMVMAGTVLLAIPLATLSAVPDYRHNFWLHVLNSGFTSVSASCLVGISHYSFGEDHSRFGQAVILVQTQLAGMLLAAMGLAAVRPFLRCPPTLRLILSLSLVLQLLAVGVMWTSWQAADAATPGMRGWWGLVHATSALWNTGWTMRADGLATYFTVPVVYGTITMLSIVGSLGLPILIELLRTGGRKAASEVAGVPAWQRLPIWEISAALIVLVLVAGVVFVLETPGFLPESLVPDRPVDFGNGRVSIRDDMSHRSRWTMAVFVSATLRSSGIQSLPLSEGAVSWPTYALLIVFMGLGGSMGGTAGGMGISALLVLLMALLTRRLAWTSHTGGYDARRLLLRGAAGVVSVSLALNALAILSLIIVTDGTLYEEVFDATAALAGVGLSTGLALHLTSSGKLVMMLWMACGRVIPLLLWLRMSGRLAALTMPQPRPMARPA